MPKSCCVVHCTANIKKNKDVRFSMLPQRDKEAERRGMWLQVIRRQTPDGKPWDPTSKFVYVCGQHFVTGYHVKSKDHPDYVPSIFPNRRVTDGRMKLERYKNARKRNMQKERQDHEHNTKEVSGPVSLSPTNSANSATPPTPAPDEMLAGPFDLQVAVEMANLRRERDEARRERDEAIQEAAAAKSNWSKERLCASAIRDRNKTCMSMTGISWIMFEVLHRFLVQFISNCTRFKMSTEDQLFICLLKLRQNPSMALLSQVLNKPQSTLTNIFHRWLDLLYAKIGFYIHWPDRESIFDATPPAMRAKFPRLTSIIDCFEIRIQYSKFLKARTKSYSQYKKWTTVKYLLCCSPAGSITFLSKAWGGRASDVKVVRESGFVSPLYHFRGDQILADRGFTMKDDFALLGVELITPAFTKGKRQLPGKDVEESRVKSRVRIHVERVIGALKRRFHILNGPLPVAFVKTLRDEIEYRDVCTIDKIVHVCGVLINMSDSVVYNKNRWGDVRG